MGFSGHNMLRVAGLAIIIALLEGCAAPRSSMSYRCEEAFDPQASQSKRLNVFRQAGRNAVIAPRASPVPQLDCIEQALQLRTGEEDRPATFPGSRYCRPAGRLPPETRRDLLAAYEAGYEESYQERLCTRPMFLLLSEDQIARCRTSYPDVIAFRQTQEPLRAAFYQEEYALWRTKREEASALRNSKEDVFAAAADSGNPDRSEAAARYYVIDEEIAQLEEEAATARQRFIDRLRTLTADCERKAPDGAGGKCNVFFFRNPENAPASHGSQPGLARVDACSVLVRQDAAAPI